MIIYGPQKTAQVINFCSMGNIWKSGKNVNLEREHGNVAIDQPLKE